MVAAIAAAGVAVSAGTQMYSASQQSGAAKGGQSEVMTMFNQLQKLLGPYAAAGTSALPELQALLGAGGTPGSPANTAAMQNQLENMPGYEFALNQGLKSTQNSFGSRGLGISGAAMKGADQFSTGLASGTYNSLVQQLQALTGMGENAAAGVGTAGMGAGTTIAQLMQNAATAQGAGAVGAGNSLSIGGLLTSLLGGGGGAGAASSAGNMSDILSVASDVSGF
jgi:hypothetical protein